jgi:LAO/AO transport system kinase
VEIARVAGVTLVVLVPGLGDEVQVLKAGLMEIADVFVVNKSDRAGADRLESELLACARRAPIVKTVATRGEGVKELLEAVRAIEPRPSGSRRASEFAIDHVGIAVRSIEAALKFYEGALGFRVEGRETVEREMVRVAMLPFAGGRLELLEAAGPASPIAKFIEKRGEGLHHIAIRTPDFEAALERLRASGARLLNEPRQGAGGHTYVFVHPASAGGVLLELIKES